MDIVSGHVSKTRVKHVASVLSEMSIQIFLVVSLFILVLNLSGKVKFEKLSSVTRDVFSPAVSLFVSPVSVVFDVSEFITGIISIYDNNKILLEENQKLKNQVFYNLILAKENYQMKKLLNFVDNSGLKYISARLMSKSNNGYNQSFSINAGCKQGVENGYAIVNEKGFVGRIIDVSYNSAQILLLNDVSSRVPIITEKSSQRLILAGNGGNLLDILYLPANAGLQDGELAFTSGDGEIFPYGLPVALIKVGKDKKARAIPLVDVNKIDIISVIKYGNQLDYNIWHDYSPCNQNIPMVEN